jgi:beta-lactam-binding protein with PASTA domain
VPQVTGQTQTDAENQLRSAGFRVKIIAKIDGSKAPGIVLTQSPSQNQAVPANTVVTLEVAQAPAVVSPSPSLLPPSQDPSPSPSLSPSPTESPVI